MDTPAGVTVEFFGLPRARAARSHLVVAAATAQEVLRRVEELCPALHCLLASSQILISLNGLEFVSDLSRPLKAGDHLLLLSAEAGG